HELGVAEVDGPAVLDGDLQLPAAEPADIRREPADGGGPAALAEHGGAADDVGLVLALPARPFSPDGVIPYPLQQVGEGAGRVADVERGREPSNGGLGQVELGYLRRDPPYPGQFLVERDLAGQRRRAEVNGDPGTGLHALGQRRAERVG